MRVLICASATLGSATTWQLASVYFSVSRRPYDATTMGRSAGSADASVFGPKLVPCRYTTSPPGVPYGAAVTPSTRLPVDEKPTRVTSLTSSTWTDTVATHDNCGTPLSVTVTVRVWEVRSS